MKLKISNNVTIFFGDEEAVKLRMAGWDKVKEEQLILISPETTPKKRIKAAEIKRGKAVSKEKVSTKFIENISDSISLEKNLKRLEQGIEVRYYPHHGFSLAIRDKKTVLMEFPTKDELLNVQIDDEEFAKQMINYFNTIWNKAKPLDKQLIEELEKSLK